MATKFILTFVVVPKHGAECKPFKINSIDCLWKQILSASIFTQLCLKNCRQANDRLDDHLFDSDKFCITVELI